MLHTFTVDALDVSSAWLKACRSLAKIPGGRGYHTVVRIADPRSERVEVHAELERLRIAGDKYPMEAVINTLFPSALAASCRDHAELARRYLALYERLRKADRRNVHGTYFGRLVGHPGREGAAPVDQLGLLIARLRKLSHSSRWNAVYEAGTVHVEDGPPPVEEVPADLPIRDLGGDTQMLDFPCLSHVSFQLESGTGTVHTVAYYRSHYMFDRAYGNYLALGKLNAWVAEQAGLRPGRLMVVAGVAHLDCSQKILDRVDKAQPADLLGLVSDAQERSAAPDAPRVPDAPAPAASVSPHFGGNHGVNGAESAR
ncbi:hypothetical protein EHYA_09627 [Embleya hyalina]|uniref:Thymidylate synthase n=1 Tax=Embleya hyalina TaxID=516124 RepID=A0A401Z4T0_9ACTN|nr:hypothetical protein EHYA_09627 [Embleya hyalina]